jgi:hypothetical protein
MADWAIPTINIYIQMPTNAISPIDKLVVEWQYAPKLIDVYKEKAHEVFKVDFNNAILISYGPSFQ